MPVRNAIRRPNTCALPAAALLVAAAATAFAGSGNYLIIVAEEFATSAPLMQFADAKAALGFNVSTHTVPAGTSNVEIKAYIQSLWGTAQAPDYILLVGDTPAIPHWVGQGSRQAATDLPYACMDAGDDWYPDMFIGRFSVSTVAELQAVVDKSLFVEAGDFSDPDYIKRAAFLATSDPTAEAEQTHDWVITTYLEPANFNCTRIYASQNGGTADITAAVNAGCLFTVYFGHSGSTGWSSPGFSQGNVESLSNTGLYGLVMGWSCNTANYSYDECFGETWIREADKGAAAYLSASDYIWWGSVEDWESSRRMEKYFFQSIFTDDIWEVSPAWQAALWRILADPDFGPDHDHTRNIFEEFTLLGDPALLLPQGDGFMLAAQPGVHDVCCPPECQAVYTIDVNLTGEFNESVTLDVTGEPPGATVDFSIATEIPPFTTVLTIGQLAAVPAGEYDIQVTGVSVSMQRSTSVRLRVSNDAPGTVTLLSPPDGEVDVARMPTLSWTPATAALEYHVQVADDPGFSHVVYTATVADTSMMLPFNLDSLTVFHWRVRAGNGCGDSSYSAPFSFTTIEQQDYFTEQFKGSFDLDGLMLTFTPDGSGQYYKGCAAGISSLPTDPTGGTPLSLDDDDYAAVTPSATLHFYNVPYNTLYIGSNGYVTFGGGDMNYEESLADHFSRPRVAALFDDLAPHNGGTVSWRETSDRMAVTWEGVPEYSHVGANTFQIELFHDGRVTISWLGISSTDSVVGLSQGLGLPSDFLMSNLSATPPCSCAGDCNCDDVVNWRDIDYFVAAMNDNVAAWEAMFLPGTPPCPFANNDVNGDGTVDWHDIDPLVAVMNTTCP